MRISPKHPQCSDLDLASIEQHLGTDLPRDYRDFLRQNNGGEPDRAFFSFERKGRNQTAWIDGFRWLGDASKEVTQPSPDDDSVLWGAAQYTKYIPEHCIPIAGGPNIEVVVFGGGAREGQVWIRMWDDFTSDNPEDGLYKLASSFGEFLSMLQEDPGT